MPAQRGLHGQRLLLCVCGGSAAYNAAELVRRLCEAGATVQVAMTDSAQRFVGAQTFQALSGRPVRTSLWDAAAEAALRPVGERADEHVEVPRLRRTTRQRERLRAAGLQ